MKPHTKIYMDFFGYSEEDFIPCEVCSQRAVDIHHLKSRGMGGDPKKKKDVIENLMALCRKCHEDFGDISLLREKLSELHLKFMKIHQPI